MKEVQAIEAFSHQREHPALQKHFSYFFAIFAHLDRVHNTRKNADIFDMKSW